MPQIDAKERYTRANLRVSVIHITLFLSPVSSSPSTLQNSTNKMPHSGIFNGHMSTITGHPSGFTEASKLHDRTGKEALPELSVALPESGDPQNSNQDLGIREQPSWAEMQIWSNNRYHAPEHRVLTSSSRVRYSAPFFLNPAFDSVVAPLPSLGPPEYLPCVWGYFRAQRFAGDFADYGTEIQISDFAVGPGGEPTSWHVDNQARFMQKADFGAPFSVEANRPLLARPADAGATGAK